MKFQNYEKMKKIDDLLMECNTFQSNHYTIITNESPFQSYMTYLPKYRNDLQTLIFSLTEAIDIMDTHYKCFESCSILIAEADELNEKLISYEDILTSDSIKDYKLSTIRDDLNNISIQIDSLNEKFKKQEFPTAYGLCMINLKSRKGY